MAPEGPQIFPGARNFVIRSGTFAAVNGDMKIYSPISERYGMKLLLENISSDAFHDAAQPGHTPRCHPGTRVAILKQLMEWLKDPAADRKLVIWLFGPAGAGKTAIQHSIAVECQKEGLLASSFFFSRMGARRRNLSRFAATLAYQLLVSIPEIREPILSAIEKDPAIFSRTLAVKIETLVVLPLKSMQTPLRTLPLVVVIDGIDECGPNSESQTELLTVLGTAAAQLRHIPVIFLIASRPEFTIRRAFDRHPLSALMKRLHLDDDYRSNQDIQLYLKDKFQDIRQNQQSLGTHLPVIWPPERDINWLVKQSSGHFIFAATVINFINSARNDDPVELLNIILGRVDAGRNTPFAALDSLYHLILSEVLAHDLPKVLTVLTLLVLAKDYSYSLRVDQSSALLGFSVRRTLIDMHALLFVPNHNQEVVTGTHNLEDVKVLRIYHASLYDFLLDRSRSREFFIDARKGHISLSKRWLELIANHYPQPNNPPLKYCISRFVFHVNRSPGSAEIADCLAEFNLRALLDNINDADDLYDTDWKLFFECARQQGGARPDIFPRFRGELYAFYVDRLLQYPRSLQPYIHVIFCHRNRQDTGIFFRILERDRQLLVSDAMFAELDQRLLMTLQKRRLRLNQLSHWRPGPESHHGNQAREYDEDFCPFDKAYDEDFCSPDFFRIFLEEAGESKCHFDHQKNYTAMAKKVFNALYPVLSNELAIFEPDLHLKFGEYLLNYCSVDLDLAKMLQERALQCYGKTRSFVMRAISKSCLKYIQSCGIQYLKHTHSQHTVRCIVCEDCDGASVDEDTADIPSYALLPSDSPATATESISPALQLVYALSGSSSSSICSMIEDSPLCHPPSIQVIQRRHFKLKRNTDATTAEEFLTEGLKRSLKRNREDPRTSTCLLM